MTWKESFLNDLCKKAELETIPFQEIVNQYNALMNRCVILEFKNRKLQHDSLLHGEEIARSTRSDSDSNSATTNTTNDITKKEHRGIIEQLKNLETKLQSSDAAVELAMESQSLRTDLAQTKADLFRAEKTLHDLAKNGDKLNIKLEGAEIDKVLLRQELVKERALLEAYETQVMDLKRQNQDLVDRLISEKTKMAEQLNLMLESHASNNTNKHEVEFVDLGDVAMELVSGNVSHLKADERTSRSLGRSLGTIIPGAPLFTIEAHKSEIFDMCYNEDGTSLATGSSDGIVKLWSTIDGNQRGTLRGSDAANLCLVSKGGYVLGGFADKNARLWSLETERLVHTLSGHRDKVYSAAFLPDMKSIITGGGDRYIRLWDLRSGYNVKTISCRSTCFALDASPDGVTIVSGHRDKSLRFWDIRTCKLLHEAPIHGASVISASFSTADSGPPTVLSLSRDNSLKVVDSSSYYEINTLKHPDFRCDANWQDCGFSPNSCYAVSGGSDGNVYIWDTMSASIATILRDGHNSSIASSVWSPDGGQVATGDKNGQVVLWQ